jgi:hypothetical protein
MKQRLPGLLGQCYDVIAARTDAPDEFINAAVINLSASLIGRKCTIPFARKGEEGYRHLAGGASRWRDRP